MKAEIFIGLGTEEKDIVLVGTPKKYIDSSIVLNYVANKFNLSVDELKSIKKTRNLATARQAYVWLFRSLVKKKGLSDGLDHKFSVEESNRKRFTTTKSMMNAINRHHCGAAHSYRTFQNAFFTDKQLKKNAYEWLDELDKMFI